MLQRLIGAFKGDIATYEEIEHDPGATVEAAGVVVVAAVLGGLGAGFSNQITGGDDASSFGRVFIFGVIAALLGWLVWSVATHFIGSTFFGAQSSIGEMLRVIGYASVVLWLVIIPVIGFLAVFWYLWVVFKAIRAGLDISTGKTLIVVIIGFIIRALASVLPIL